MLLDPKFPNYQSTVDMFSEMGIEELPKDASFDRLHDSGVEVLILQGDFALSLRL